MSESEQVVSGWRPIESADKRRRIIGWDGTHVAVTYWNDDFRQWRDESDATDDGYGRESVPVHGVWEPTHWLPLPLPPQENE